MLVLWVLGVLYNWVKDFKSVMDLWLIWSRQVDIVEEKKGAFNKDRFDNGLGVKSGHLMLLKWSLLVIILWKLHFNSWALYKNLMHSEVHKIWIVWHCENWREL